MVSKPKAPSRSEVLAEEEAKRQREEQAAIEAQRVREQEAQAQGRRSLISGISGSRGVQEDETSLF